MLSSLAFTPFTWSFLTCSRLRQWMGDTSVRCLTGRFILELVVAVMQELGWEES